jgi:hypothetical protein
MWARDVMPEAMQRRAPCKVVLTHIKFNHDPLSLAADAMNIRVDGLHEVSVPEWKSGYSAPEQSPAAYAIAETAGRSITIQCRFTITPKTSTKAWVKATGGGLLGVVDPVEVTFVNGVSHDTSHGGDPEFISITLRHSALGVIERQDIAWTWDYRCDGHTHWHKMDLTTRHRVYVMLREPPEPWSQTDPNKYPWTWALDYAIVNAGTRGLADMEIATARVVRHVYDEPLQYDIWYGEPSYGGNMFQITDWLDGFRNGPIVNCYDCAGAVTTFATVLGADAQYNFHQPFGYLKPVYPIGRGLCNNPFYGSSASPYDVPLVAQDDAGRTSFGNHAYAKRSSDHKNFDACMKAPRTGCKWIDALLALLIALGAAWAERLLLQRAGWLIALTQPDYETKVLDASLPGAGGHPVVESMDLSP